MSNSYLHLRSFVKTLRPISAIKYKSKRRALLRNSVNLENAINMFVNRTLSQEEHCALITDMKRKAEVYGFSFEEYFLLKLNEKSKEEVEELISDLEHVVIAERMNKGRNQAIFDDKALTYEYFGQYYRRACMFIDSSKSGVNKMLRFQQAYGDFIIKPVEMAGGGGIEIIRLNDSKSLLDAIDKLLKQYKKGVLVEEVIYQVPEMSRIHPASVNTLRIPTIRVGEGETIVFHPCLRVGVGDAIVDNASSGGIICALDRETGTVIAAADELGRRYEKHPETGVKLVGYQVPLWNEAVEYAKKLAEVVPTNRYTGWDLALTEKGWVMVEGNARGQFIWQYATLQGCRSELNSLFMKMGIKYRRNS